MAIMRINVKDWDKRPPSSSKPTSLRYRPPQVDPLSKSKSPVLARCVKPSDTMFKPNKEPVRQEDDEMNFDLQVQNKVLKYTIMHLETELKKQKKKKKQTKTSQKQADCEPQHVNKLTTEEQLRYYRDLEDQRRAKRNPDSLLNKQTQLEKEQQEIKRQIEELKQMQFR